MERQSAYIDKLNMRGKGRVGVSELMLWLIVALSFLVQYFTGILHALWLLLLIILGCSLIYVFTKPIPKRNQNIWLVALGGLAISYISASHTIANMNELFILFVGLLLIKFPNNKARPYENCLKIIAFFSIYYMITVWVQFFLPGIFKIYLSLLDEGARVHILSLQNTYGFCGFSTNTGFTAGHLIAGIMVFSENIKSTSQNRRIKSCVLVLLLFVTLLMTGKRGHLLFLILAFGVRYLLIVSGARKLGRIGKLFIVGIVIIVFFFLFKDFFVDIPVISRIIETIDTFMNEGDITSGRNMLRQWGWMLFIKNPLFGIGWGNFKETVVGNVTNITELDAHNIYIQMLCEMGIVGFLCMVVPMAMSLIQTKNAVCQCASENTIWRKILNFSLLYQLFFLLYGLTGNPLYDTNYLLLYLVSCAMTSAYELFMKKMVRVSNK